MKQHKWFWLITAMMLFAVACFSGCSSDNEIVIETYIIESPEMYKETQEATEAPTDPIPAYTEADIQAAKDVVAAKFNKDFTGCELLRLEYIEGKYQSDYEYYAKRCAVDSVMVLETDFFAGQDAPASLNQDHTYHNWKWILIDDGSGWTVWTSGYA